VTLSGKRIYETALISAPDLRVGDRMPNMGDIQAISKVGVFYVLQLRFERWSLATGMPAVTCQDWVVHAGDEVLVMVTR
jgi:hypothetical protein